MLLEELNTLKALLEYGTMSKVSSQLYISPSAVSKRIDRLEQSLKQKLITQQGRRVALTPFALHLLNELTPALNHIQTTLAEQITEQDDSLVHISCGESLLVAYLAPLFAELLQKDPFIRITTEHTPVTIEKVQAGKAVLGINNGCSADYPDLIFEHIRNEPFCLYPNDLDSQHPTQHSTQHIICIDLNFPSNHFLKEQLAANDFHPFMQMESYMAIIESAKAGLAPGLIPQGLAHHFNLDPKRTTKLSIHRPCYLCYRKHILKKPRLQQILASIRTQLATTPNTAANPI